MFSLSPMKIFIIVAVVVMLLGPDKLPEVAHRLGSAWQSLRRFQQRVEEEVRGTIPDLPSTSEIARMARSPVSVLNQLAERATNASASSSSRENDNAAPGGLLSEAPRASAPSTEPPVTGSLSADPSLN